MSFSKEDIDYMRKQGMSDDDIISGLSQEDPQLAKDIEFAKQHGVSQKDILGHLDELAQSPSDQNTDSADSGKSTGYLDALKYGASKALQGTGKTLESFDATKDWGNRLENLGKDFDNSDSYQPTHVTLNPATWGQVPRALLESAPGAAASIAGGAAGAAAGGVVGGPIGAGIGGLAGAGLGGDLSYLGNNLQNRLANNGQTNPDLANASTLDKLIAGSSAFGQGALNRVGVGGAVVNPITKGAGVGNVLSQLPGQIAKSAGTGALAGGGSEALGQVGSTIGTDKGIGAVDLGDIANSAASGAVAGGGGRVAKAAVNDLPNAVRFKEAQAFPDRATDVANILQDTGENLSNPKGAYKALKSATDTLGDEISDHADAVKKADPTTSDVVDNTVKALDKGKTLTDDQMQAVQDTLKGVQGGDDLMDSIQKFHVLNDLKTKGKVDDSAKTVTGGFNSGILGTITNPIGAIAKKSPMMTAAGVGAGSLGVGEAALHALQHGATDAIASAAGTAALPIGALVMANRGLKGIDASTGFNAPVAQFAQRFGQPTADPIMSAAQKAAQARQAANQIQPPAPAGAAPAASQASLQAPAPVPGGVIQLAQAAAARAQARQAQPAQQPQANAGAATGAPSTVDPAILSRLQAKTQDSAGPKAPSSPAGETYTYHGIEFPIPDDVRYKPAYIKSLRRNQDMINQTLDKDVYGDHGGLDEKTFNAIEANRTALKTARNQDDAKGVINRIIKQSHPEDRPQLRNAFDEDFFKVWSKKSAGPK